jgi:GntR family transcriptional regulator, transcriptional repressor for pyruvate dehydrogenase complex
VASQGTSRPPAPDPGGTAAVGPGSDGPGPGGRQDRLPGYRLPDVGPIGHTKVTEWVVTALRTFIEANGMRPGDKLPPERVFIEQLGVSRSSLREALRVLSTLGLIEVRRGDGMYVAAPPDGWAGSATALFDATEENALRNLVETRMGIELAATIAATQRATEEDLTQLQWFLDEQGRQLRGDPGYEWEPLAFELAVVEITGNTWLYDVEVMLRDAWRSLSGDLRASVRRHHEWHSEHGAILASMRSRNVAQVQRLVVAHLSLERFEDDLASRGPAGHRPGRPARGRTRP